MTINKSKHPPDQTWRGTPDALVQTSTVKITGMEGPVTSGGKAGESKDPRAVEALVKALKDKDRNVREAAAGSLGRIGDASAVDALLEALKDYDQCVRRAMRWA